MAANSLKEIVIYADPYCLEHDDVKFLGGINLLKVRNYEFCSLNACEDLLFLEI